MLKIAAFHELTSELCRKFLLISIILAFGVHSDSVLCSNNGNSIWMRNRCQNRFVIPGKKCVTAREGFNMTDKRVEIIREACHDPMEPTLVLTRLYSVHRNRFICFDTCGRLRSIVSIFCFRK